MTTPTGLIVALIVTVLLASAFTGSSFYIAGRREQDRQKRDELDSRIARRDAAEVYQTMQTTIRELSERLNNVEDDAARARVRIRELEQNLAMLTRQLTEAIDGAERLIQQLAAAGVTKPVYVPAKVVTVQPVDQMVLQDQMRRRFNVEELDDIAQRIGISPEDIAGQTRQKRARELVAMAERRDLMDDLLEVVRELRPSVEW